MDDIKKLELLLSLLRNFDINTFQNIIAEYKTRNINEVYAIRDLANCKIIWNSRGGAYKDKMNVESKVRELSKSGGVGRYKVMTYKLIED